MGHSGSLPHVNHQTDIDFTMMNKEHLSIPTPISPKHLNSLQKAVFNKDLKKMRQLLGEKNRDINKLDSRHGFTALYVAAEMGHVESAMLLLNPPAPAAPKLGFKKGAEPQDNVQNRRADPNVTNLDGRTPLHMAVITGNVEMTRLLLDSHAEINAVDILGCSCMHYAILREDLPLFQLLLQQGASIKIVDKSGDSLLHHAIRLGQAHMAIALIEKGHEIDIENEEKRTPLLYAVEKGILPVVRILLNKGANPLAADLDGKKPMDLLDPTTNPAQQDILDLLTLKAIEREAKTNIVKKSFFESGSMSEMKKPPLTTETILEEVEHKEDAAAPVVEETEVVALEAPIRNVRQQNDTQRKSAIDYANVTADTISGVSELSTKEGKASTGKHAVFKGKGTTRDGQFTISSMELSEDDPADQSSLNMSLDSLEELSTTDESEGDKSEEENDEDVGKPESARPVPQVDPALPTKDNEQQELPKNDEVVPNKMDTTAEDAVKSQVDVAKKEDSESEEPLGTELDLSDEEELSESPLDAPVGEPETHINESKQSEQKPKTDGTLSGSEVSPAESETSSKSSPSENAPTAQNPETTTYPPTQASRKIESRPSNDPTKKPSFDDDSDLLNALGSLDSQSDMLSYASSVASSLKPSPMVQQQQGRIPSPLAPAKNESPKAGRKDANDQSAESTPRQSVERKEVPNTTMQQAYATSGNAVAATVDENESYADEISEEDIKSELLLSEEQEESQVTGESDVSELPDVSSKSSSVATSPAGLPLSANVSQEKNLKVNLDGAKVSVNKSTEMQPSNQATQSESEDISNDEDVTSASAASIQQGLGSQGDALASNNVKQIVSPDPAPMKLEQCKNVVAAKSSDSLEEMTKVPLRQRAVIESEQQKIPPNSDIDLQKRALQKQQSELEAQRRTLDAEIQRRVDVATELERKALRRQQLDLDAQRKLMEEQIKSKLVSALEQERNALLVKEREALEAKKKQDEEENRRWRDNEAARISAELQKQEDTLKKQFHERLEKARKDLEAQRNELMMTRQQMEEAQNAARMDVERRTSQIDEAKAAFAREMQVLQQQKQNQAQEEWDNLEKERAEIEEMRREAEAMINGNKAQLERDSSAFKEREKEMHLNVERLEKLRVELDREKQSFQKEREVFARRVQAHQKTIEEETARLAKERAALLEDASKEIEAKRQEIVAEKQQMETDRVKLQELIREFEVATETQRASNANLAATSDEYDERLEEVEKREAEVAVAEESLDEQAAELEQRRNDLEMLNQALEKERISVLNERQIVEEMMKSAQRRLEEIENRGTEVDERSRQLEAKSRDFETQTHHLDNERRRFEDTKRDVHERARDVEDKLREVERKAREVDERFEELLQMRSDVEALRRKSANELETLRQKQEEAQQQRKQHDDDERERLESQVQELTSKLEAAEQRAQNLAARSEILYREVKFLKRVVWEGEYSEMIALGEGQKDANGVTSTISATSTNHRDSAVSSRRGDAPVEKEDVIELFTEDALLGYVDIDILRDRLGGNGAIAEQHASPRHSQITQDSYISTDSNVTDQSSCGNSHTSGSTQTQAYADRLEPTCLMLARKCRTLQIAIDQAQAKYAQLQYRFEELQESVEHLSGKLSEAQQTAREQVSRGAELAQELERERTARTALEGHASQLEAQKAKLFADWENEQVERAREVKVREKMSEEIAVAMEERDNAKRLCEARNKQIEMLRVQIKEMTFGGKGVPQESHPEARPVTGFDMAHIGTHAQHSSLEAQPDDPTKPDPLKYYENEIQILTLKLEEERAHRLAREEEHQKVMESLSELEENLTELKRLYENELNENREREVERQRLVKELSGVRANLVETEKKLGNVERSVVGGLKETVARLEGTLVERDASLKALERQIAEAAENEESTKTELQNCRLEIRSRQEQIHALEEELDRAAKQLEKTKQAAEAKLAQEVSKETTKLRKELVERARKEVEDLRSAHSSAMVSAREAHEREVGRARKEAREDALHENLEALRDAERKASKAQSAVERLEAVLAEKDRVLDDLKVQLEGARGTRRQLESELDTLRRSLDAEKTKAQRLAMSTDNVMVKLIASFLEQPVVAGGSATEIQQIAGERNSTGSFSENRRSSTSSGMSGRSRSLSPVKTSSLERVALLKRSSSASYRRKTPKYGGSNGRLNSSSSAINNDNKSPPLTDVFSEVKDSIQEDVSHIGKLFQLIEDELVKDLARCATVLGDVGVDATLDSLTKDAVTAVTSARQRRLQETKQVVSRAGEGAVESAQSIDDQLRGFESILSKWEKTKEELIAESDKRQAVAIASAVESAVRDVQTKLEKAHKQTCAALEEQVKRLENEFARKEAHVREVHAEETSRQSELLAQQQLKCRKIEQQIRDVEDEYVSKEGKLMTRHREEVKALQESLARSQQGVKALEDRLSDLKKEFARKEAIIEEEHRAQLKKHTDMVAQLQHRCGELEAKVKSMELEIASHVDRIQTLTTEKAVSGSEKAADLERVLKSKMAILEEREKVIAEYEAMTSQFKKRVMDLEREIHNKELEYLKQENERRVVIQNLENEAALLKEANGALKRVFQGAKKNVSELEGQIRDLQKQNSSLHLTNSQRQTEFEAISAKLRQTTTTLESRCQELEEKYRQTQVALSQRIEDVHTAESARKRAEKEMKTLQDESAVLSARYQKMAADMVGIKVVNDELQVRIGEVEGTLRKTDGALREALADVEKLQGVKTKTEAEKNAVREELEVKSRELGRVSRELEGAGQQLRETLGRLTALEKTHADLVAATVEVRNEVSKSFGNAGGAGAGGMPMSPSPLSPISTTNVDLRGIMERQFRQELEAQVDRMRERHDAEIQAHLKMRKQLEEQIANLEIQKSECEAKIRELTSTLNIEKCEKTAKQQQVNDLQERLTRAEQTARKAELEKDNATRMLNLSKHTQDMIDVSCQIGNFAAKSISAAVAAATGSPNVATPSTAVAPSATTANPISPLLSSPLRSESG
ncbi:hypothetical protein HK102_003453, partial [Quaeritorhiza haematococci]